MKTLYLLEDDASIGELVTCALSMQDIEVTVFGTVKEFYEGMRRRLPSIAILDLMLPDGNGLDVLARIKKSYPDVPVIIMSALSRETDKVRGLNSGADDYIGKPFGVLEMAARVTALLRRSEKGAQTIECGGIALDEKTHTATVNGQPLSLNPKEFGLLKYFMQNRGIVLTREQILEAVWGYDGGETRTVDNHVARLRKNLPPECLQAVFGIGYKFAPIENDKQ